MVEEKYGRGRAAQELRRSVPPCSPHALQHLTAVGVGPELAAALQIRIVGQHDLPIRGKKYTQKVELCLCVAASTNNLCSSKQGLHGSSSASTLVPTCPARPQREWVPRSTPPPHGSVRGTTCSSGSISEHSNSRQQICHSGNQARTHPSYFHPSLIPLASHL